MKYYSEKLNKTFDTEADCLAAEKKHEEELAAKKKQEEQALATKKELAKEIESAEEKVNLAYKDYDAAVEAVKKLREEFNKKAEEILNPAKEAISKAQEDRYKAIRAFNERYGVYTTTLSGDKAAKELDRITHWIDSVFPFNDIFRF